MEKFPPNSNTNKHPDGSLSLLNGKRRLISGDDPLAAEIATSHEIIIRENAKNLELEHELTHSSMIPELFNKKGFLQEVKKSLSKYRGFAAMIYFDANGFKKINDNYGHAVGDAVIKEIGKAILSVSRKMTTEAAQDSSKDLLSHQSGDEFCALLMPKGESVYNKDQAELAAERYLDRLKKVLRVVQIDNQSFDLSLSSGVVIFDKTKDYSVDIQKIIKEADKCMLASKSER